MKISVVFLLFAGAICASGETETKDFSLAHQFLDYVKKVDATSSLWETFLQTPPSNEQKRQETLDEFLAEHNRTLILQFEWFSSALTGDVTNAHLSLQQSLLVEHRLSLTAAKAALDAAIETFKKASLMELNVLIMTNGNIQAGENLQKKIAATRSTAEENAKIVIENYKQTGWKKFLDQDIQNLVKHNLASKKLLQNIFDFLKASYPFRTWLVLNYRSNDHLPYRSCLESRPFIHRYYYNDERTELLIAHGPLKRRFGSSSEANLRLSRLMFSDWHWRRCHLKAGDVYTELKYTCGSKRHCAVMVFPTTTNELTYLTTNDGFVHQRTVQRHFPLLCHQNYDALIFC